MEELDSIAITIETNIHLFSFSIDHLFGEVEVLSINLFSALSVVSLITVTFCQHLCEAIP